MARFNFSPVSSAQSGLLQFASAYFLLNGVIYGLMVIAALVALSTGSAAMPRTAGSALAIAVGATTGVGLIWTSSQLGRGTRIGGYMALGFVLLPVAFAVVTRQAMDWLEIVSAVLGVVVFALIWHELT